MSKRVIVEFEIENENDLDCVLLPEQTNEGDLNWLANYMNRPLSKMVEELFRRDLMLKALGVKVVEAVDGDTFFGVIKWHRDDIRSLAEEEGYRLTEDQIEDAIEELEERLSDCSSGNETITNWIIDNAEDYEFEVIGEVEPENDEF